METYTGYVFAPDDYYVDVNELTAHITTNPESLCEDISFSFQRIIRESCRELLIESIRKPAPAEKNGRIKKYTTLVRVNRLLNPAMKKFFLREDASNIMYNIFGFRSSIYKNRLYLRVRQGKSFVSLNLSSALIFIRDRELSAAFVETMDSYPIKSSSSSLCRLQEVETFKHELSLVILEIAKGKYADYLDAVNTFNQSDYWDSFEEYCMEELEENVSFFNEYGTDYASYALLAAYIDSFSNTCSLDKYNGPVSYMIKQRKYESFLFFFRQKLPSKMIQNILNGYYKKYEEYFLNSLVD